MTTDSFRQDDPGIEVSVKPRMAHYADINTTNTPT